MSGPETLLAERAVTRIVELARQQDPQTELVRQDASECQSGCLQQLTSPSLFAEPKVVVMENVEKATDAALHDLELYLQSPQPDMVLIIRHGGGQRGKRFLEVVRQQNVPTIVCDTIKTDSQKSTFVTEEFAAAKRRAESRAIKALVEAIGSDLRELAAACSQIISDTTGLISADVVNRYYGGRIEATGFQVADAAVTGDAGRAVELLRHAVATGTDPVPMVAALASRLRTLAKVAAVRGQGSNAASALGLAPWQVDRAVSDLRYWSPDGLAAAITAVATADAQVKGASRDPMYAVERVVLIIAGLATRAAR